MREQRIIRLFVKHLAKYHVEANIEIDQWPDKINRDTQDIDAIAGPFAIEHTSIDSVENQRQHNDWYLQVVNGLEQIISEAVTGGLSITFGYQTVTKGINWESLRADLINWIRGQACDLQDGQHQINLLTSQLIDPPVVMNVYKSEAGPTGFSRFAPKTDGLSKRIKQLLDRKAKKLCKYQETHTTVILFENNDIALMDEITLKAAFREAYPENLQPEGVAQVWFANTIETEKPRFLKLSDTTPHDRNEFNFFNA